MQRTAKNHAPYQSFPIERNHKIGTVARCAALWIPFITVIYITFSYAFCNTRDLLCIHNRISCVSTRESLVYTQEVLKIW